MDYFCTDASSGSVPRRVLYEMVFVIRDKAQMFYILEYPRMVEKVKGRYEPQMCKNWHS